jgi:predicted secreted protein
MRTLPQRIAAALLVTSACGLWAQISPAAAPQNVVQLAASGSVEVVQDSLSIALTTTRDGTDAGQVQSQLKAALDSALSEARKSAQPGLLEVRTGNFQLQPRYGRDGKVNGWQGSTELVLEGRDLSLVSATAGRIQTLTLGQVQFSLSLEQRIQAETQAQSQAIERFRTNAADIARAFGFGSYTLREVAVHANEQGIDPRVRILAMDSASSAAAAPVPVEAGKSTVLVTVSGSVQLLK